MTSSATTLLLSRAYVAATQDRLKEMVTLLSALATVSPAGIPVFPEQARKGWESEAGWTPSSLIATVCLGPDLGVVRQTQAFFQTWKTWADRERAVTAHPVRRGATATGLTLLAWAHLDLEYEWGTEDRDEFHATVGSALHDTLSPAQQAAANLEDPDSNLHLLLDPTHPTVFASVRAFASEGERDTWPSPQAHANHVRRVVRHAAARLAEQALDDRQTHPHLAHEHFPEGSHARWLDLVRHKLLTVAYARSEGEAQYPRIRQWAAWLYRPALSSELYRATVVRLVAPVLDQPLKGNLRDDAVAASHWSRLLPHIAIIAPEAVALERQRDLQSRPAPATAPSRPRRRA